MAESSIDAVSFLPLSPPETSYCHSYSESHANAELNRLDRSRLGYAPRLPARATIWQTPSSPALGKTIYAYRGHSGWVTSVAWSPGGKRTASGSGVLNTATDKTVPVWGASTGTSVLTYRGHSDGVTSVTWFPDSTPIASGSLDETVQVWRSR